MSNGALYQMIKPLVPRCYSYRKFRRWLSWVRSARIIMYPLHRHEVIRGPSVGEITIPMRYCDIVWFLDSSPCRAAIRASLLAGVLRSVESLSLLLSCATRFMSHADIAGIIDASTNLALSKIHSEAIIRLLPVSVPGWCHQGFRFRF